MGLKTFTNILNFSANNPQAAQRGGGVTDLGGVQGAFGRCVEGHGLARTTGDG